MCILCNEAQAQHIYGFSQQMSDNGVLSRIYRYWFTAWQETSRVIEKLGGEGCYILFIF